MSRWLGRADTVLFLAMAGAMSSWGCADNEASIYVRAAMAVPPDSCEISPDPTALQLSSGLLDVSFGGSYNAQLLIANQLVRQGDPDRLRIETSKLQIYGADVTVLSSDDSGVTRSNGKPAKFFTPTSGFADASTGTTVGLGIASVTLIDAALARDLKQEITNTGVDQDVVAQVVVYGRTLGGLEVRSWEWPFPIHVCLGCLCGCTVDSSGTGPSNCHPGSDAPTCGTFNAMNGSCGGP
jgi:hypothetical protein